MDVVNRYVADRWGLDPATFVRPFWPGGDYEAYDYPDGCAVVDNPPFSMLSKIQAFYLDHGIKFFLFAPTLTCMTGRRCMEVDHIAIDGRITYENGAVVRTGFVTNLEPEYVLESAPDLQDAIIEACERVKRERVKRTPVYSYPMEVVTAAHVTYYSSHHTEYRVRKVDAARMPALDSQRAMGKSIYGGGLLLSPEAAAERAATERVAAERAATERAATERAAPHVWELSDREREMSRMIGEAAKAPRGA